MNVTADKHAGLNEEERAALACENVGRVARRFGTMEEADFADYPLMRESVVAHYRAARAPLEAEKQRLEARVRELEAERARLAQAVDDAAVREAELEAWKESSTKQHLKWDAVCRLADKLPRALGREYQEIITEVLEAQLAQAQKPGTPAGGIDRAAAIAEVRDLLDRYSRPVIGVTRDRFAEMAVDTVLIQRREPPSGLPEPLKVGDEVEVVCMTSPTGDWEWRKLPVVFVDPCGPWCEWRGHRMRLRGDREHIDWRRLPPAQTSRESDRQVERAIELAKRLERRDVEHREHPMSAIEPAASPPGEVTTKYLDELCRWREAPEGLRGYKPDSSDDLKGYWSVNAAWQAATLDIRANVERETAGLRRVNEELRRCLADTQAELDTVKRQMGIECAAKHEALGEVERLKGEVERVKLGAWRAALQGSVDFVHSLMGDRSEGWRDATTVIWNRLKSELDKLPAPAQRERKDSDPGVKGEG